MNEARAITDTSKGVKNLTSSEASSSSSRTSGTTSIDGGKQIRTLTISVEPDQEKLDAQSRERVLQAIQSGYHGEYITFSTADQLFAALPPKRWLLIEKLQQIGPSSLRHLARALKRDVKRVHEDVSALLQDGIVERDEQKKLVIPFASVRIEFSLFEAKAA